MRLIDGDALKKTLSELTVEGKSTKEVMGGMKVLRIMPQVVDDEPTIEAEPVKHGRWERISHFWLECSCCGNTSDNSTNYCSECGARMEGVDEI